MGSELTRIGDITPKIVQKAHLIASSPQLAVKNPKTLQLLLTVRNKRENVEF